MKFEEIISSFVMVIVTGLVLVGFTIAWYTNNNLPAVTGLEMMAAEMGSVQVALEPGGKDISELEDNAKYAEIGVEKFTNVDTGELAPGTYGQVTFYVKPITSAVTACNIVPMVRISQDGSSWYPVIGSGEASGETGSMDGNGESGSESGSTDGNSGSGGETGSTEGSSEVSGETASTDESGEASEEPGGTSESGKADNGEDNESGAANGTDTDSSNNGVEDVLTIEELYELANSHIEFFTDEAMTQKITADNAYKLFWGDEDGEAAPLTEQEATIYWKWYYEYPFTAEEETLSIAEKEAKIDTYDEEDMMIGNNISEMKFYFTFSAQ